MTGTVAVYRDVYRICTTTPCTAHFDDDGREQWEPMNHEEAAALATALTAYIVNHFTERPAA